MRKRLRIMIKWSGTVLTALLLIAWVGSARWYVIAYYGNDFVGYVGGGRIAFSHWRPDPIPWAQLNWSTGLARQRMAFQWWFEWTSERDPTLAPGYLTVGVPIWSLALLAGGPTAWLWYRDRRRAPGLCIECGYDLRGTDHGACPECGGEVRHPMSP